MSNGYNGWKNWETWNVWLWVSNDEFLAETAREIGDWDELAMMFIDQFEIPTTPDRVAWDLPCLDRDALNEALADM